MLTGFTILKALATATLVTPLACTCKHVMYGYIVSVRRKTLICGTVDRIKGERERRGGRKHGKSGERGGRRERKVVERRKVHHVHPLSM